MINLMVGDTQRVRLHAEHGYAIHQDIPEEVQAAYRRLVDTDYRTPDPRSRLTLL